MIYAYIIIGLCFLFPLIFKHSVISLLPCILGMAVSLDLAFQMSRRRFKSRDLLLNSTLFGVSVGVGTSIILYSGYLFPTDNLISSPGEIILLFSVFAGGTALILSLFAKGKIILLLTASGILILMEIPLFKLENIILMYILLILASVLIMISGYISYPIYKKFGVICCSLGGLICFLSAPIVYLIEISMSVPSIISVKPPACHASPHGRIYKKESWLHKIRRDMI